MFYLKFTLALSYQFMLNIKQSRITKARLCIPNGRKPFTIQSPANEKSFEIISINNDLPKLFGKVGFENSSKFCKKRQQNAFF